MYPCLFSTTPGQSTVTVQQRDSGTSTTEDVSADLSSEALAALRARVTELEEMVSKLTAEKEKVNNAAQKLKEEVLSLKKCHQRDVDTKVTCILSRYFTPGQIRLVIKKQMRVKWTTEDIAAAISLKSVSSKAYRYLRYKLKYPLPHVSTLRKWTATFNCDSGILHDVLSLMKAKNKSLTEFEKVTVLSFDETKISSKICIDKRRERILGPCDNVQVVMARGLLSNWKQPVYYQFDTPMTVEILNEIIVSLESCGYKVLAQVSDLGAENRSLWKKLQINSRNTSYRNPADPEREIFVFADIPHLLKLIRNHFLDKGFCLKNGETVTKDFLQQLLDMSGEINICPTFTQQHLDVKGPSRQKVKTAAQIFSNRVANALSYSYKCGKYTNVVLPTVTTLKLVNDWFDVFNSSLPVSLKNSNIKAYGLDKDKQDIVLDGMTDLMETMHVIGT